jgi:hypothetical protein
MSSALEIVGTRPVASLHRRSVVKDIADTTVSYATSSVPKMHKAELKAEAQTESVKSKNSAMKGTMIIMVLTTTNLTGTVTRSGTHPRRHQGIFPRLEAGPVASQPQAIKDREVRWVHQFGQVAPSVSTHH